VRGTMAVLNPNNGATEHSVNMDGAGYHPVALLSYGDFLFAGTWGQVRAYDNRTDQALWRNDLSGTGYGGVTLYAIQLVLLVGTRGYVIALDIRNGQELWRVSLKGSGWSKVSFCLVSNERVLVGSNGHLYGVRVSDGAVLYTDDCKGLGYGDVLFASLREPQFNMNAQPIVPLHSSEKRQ